MQDAKAKRETAYLGCQGDKVNRFIMGIAEVRVGVIICTQGPLTLQAWQFHKKRTPTTPYYSPCSRDSQNPFFQPHPMPQMAKIVNARKDVLAAEAFCNDCNKRTLNAVSFRFRASRKLFSLCLHEGQNLTQPAPVKGQGGLRK